MTRDHLLAAAAGLLIVALIVSGIAPHDRLTWLMEVMPVLIALPLMLATARRYPLTNLLYAGIFLHALVLIAGGAYTYARVPLGNVFADWFDLARNPYDKLGHFMQGFVPALVAREVLLRGAYVRTRAMLNFIVVCIVLAISASYELIEWLTALALGQGADEFLGTQGDPWDTQSDMACALLGAVLALLVLGRHHDRELEQLARRTSQTARGRTLPQEPARGARV